jgi:beta-glucosidase
LLPQGIQPRWSLKDFKRIDLKKNKSSRLSFELDQSALEQFDDNGVASVFPGEYRIYLGNGSPGERSEELGVDMVSAAFRVK